MRVRSVFGLRRRGVQVQESVRALLQGLELQGRVLDRGQNLQRPTTGAQVHQGRHQGHLLLPLLREPHEVPPPPLKTSYHHRLDVRFSSRNYPLDISHRYLLVPLKPIIPHLTNQLQPVYYAENVVFFPFFFRIAENVVKNL